MKTLIKVVLVCGAILAAAGPAGADNPCEPNPWKDDYRPCRETKGGCPDTPAQAVCSQQIRRDTQQRARDKREDLEREQRQRAIADVLRMGVEIEERRRYQEKYH